MLHGLFHVVMLVLVWVPDLQGKLLITYPKLLVLVFHKYVAWLLFILLIILEKLQMDKQLLNVFVWVGNFLKTIRYSDCF